jgi:hypothetical protein
VRIPRCRATVSEEIAAGHWGNPGRPVVFIGRQESRAALGRAGEDTCPYVDWEDRKSAFRPYSQARRPA